MTSPLLKFNLILVVRDRSISLTNFLAVVLFKKSVIQEVGLIECVRYVLHDGSAICWYELKFWALTENCFADRMKRCRWPGVSPVHFPTIIISP